MTISWRLARTKYKPSTNCCWNSNDFIYIIY